jgi:hypothetical protein
VSQLLDVLSFKDDPNNYIGFRDCVRHNDNFLERVTPTNLYVNDDVLAIYHEALTTPWACLLDCTTTGVNEGTRCNQQVHAAAVVEALEADPVRGAALQMHGMAFVFVHGGNRTFPGQVGIRFVGHDAEARVEELRTRLDEHRLLLQPKRLQDCAGVYITQARACAVAPHCGHALTAQRRGRTCCARCCKTWTTSTQSTMHSTCA